jgi:hypothetical protein
MHLPQRPEHLDHLPGDGVGLVLSDKSQPEELGSSVQLGRRVPLDAHSR